MTGLALFDYQKEGAAFLAQRRHAALFDEMGVGKSAQVVHGANVAAVKRALIVVPHIGLVNWQREIAQWGFHPDSAILTNREPVSNKSWSVINYDLLQEQTDALKALRGQRFDLIVLDECQALKNHDAARTKNVYGKAGIARNADRVWLVSGSPCPNHVGELYPALLACFPQMLRIEAQPDRRMSYEDFLRHYCKTETDARGQIKVVGSRSVEVIKLKDMLRPVMLRRTLKEVLPELPSLRFSSVHLQPRDAMLLFENSYEQQELWHALRAAAAKIDADPDDAFVAALNIMEEETLSTQRRLFGEAKVPIIADLIGHELHNGLDKIVIFFHHRAVGQELANRLSRFGADKIDGSVPKWKRQPIIDEFQANPNCRVLCASLETASTVITLTAAAHVLFAEFSWTPLTNVQAARRCARLGQRRPVLARFASLAGSLDETIAAVQARKARSLTYLFQTQIWRSQMPLDKNEQAFLATSLGRLIEQLGAPGDKYATRSEAIGSVGGTAPAGRYVESGFLAAAETLLLRLSDATGLLTNLLEKALGDADEKGSPDQEAKPPKNKGGRPRKDATAAPPQQPQTNGAQAGAGADEMFPTDGKPADDDPFAVPGEAAPSTQPQMTDVQVKAELKNYMQAWGTEGTVRLTDLLTRVAGVKRFIDLPANKWPEVVAAAKKELAGRA